MAARQEIMVAVRWCEAEVRDFEWTNTASNLVFLVAAYEGWRVAKKKRLPVEFVVAEWLLVVVFVGSVLFHGTAGHSWRAELLDEIPMVLLAHAYLWSVRFLISWARLALVVGAVVPVAGVAAYVKWQNYSVFINTLTFQYFLAGGIAFSAARRLGAKFQLKRTHFGRASMRTWVLFITSFAAGKAIWEYERHLWRSQTCPTSAWDPRFWCHAWWHILAATAHHCAMRFHGELWVARQAELRKELTRLRKFVKRRSEKYLERRGYY